MGYRQILFSKCAITAYDVKYFSLKKNEFSNNSQNSFEILVWITEEIQIPKYI